eukprot:817798-Pelagomonas_calceolata.AAC.5
MSSSPPLWLYAVCGCKFHPCNVSRTASSEFRSLCYDVQGSWHWQPLSAEPPYHGSPLLHTDNGT